MPIDSEGRDTAAKPVGWRLVPVEPTEAMLEAMTGPFIAVNGDNRKAFGSAYRAMLAAAPLPAPPAAATAITKDWCVAAARGELAAGVEEIGAGIPAVPATDARAEPKQCREPDGRCSMCGSDWSVCGCQGMVDRQAASTGGATS